MWIHTEGPDRIFKFFSAVHDLAFIKFIRQMGKDDSRKLYSHTNVYTVRLGIDL